MAGISNRNGCTTSVPGCGELPGGCSKRSTRSSEARTMGFEITCRSCEVAAYVTGEDGAAVFLSMHDHPTGGKDE